MSEQADVKTPTERVNLNPYLPVEERLKRFEVAIKAEFLKEIYADSVDHAESRPKEHDPPPQKKGRYSNASRKERRKKKQEKLKRNALLCHNASTGDSCPKES